MFTKRFVFLAGVLVTLNVALFFAAPGLALRKALVNELLGPKLIRAEGVYKKPICGSTDCHVDRGVITQVSSTELTLREFDGRIQPIPLSSTTLVVRFGRHLTPDVLAKRWHVVVTWPADGPAQSVDVEKIPHRGQGSG
ncbi:MAG: hypothetical protein ACRDKC_05925 [Gaiellaceae bacterium]